MILPYELIELIYSHLDIDSKIKFHKIFEYYNFKRYKLHSSIISDIVSDNVKIKYVHFLVQDSLLQLFDNIDFL